MKPTLSENRRRKRESIIRDKRYSPRSVFVLAHGMTDLTQQVQVPNNIDLYMYGMFEESYVIPDVPWKILLNGITTKEEVVRVLCSHEQTRSLYSYYAPGSVLPNHLLDFTPIHSFYNTGIFSSVKPSTNISTRAAEILSLHESQHASRIPKDIQNQAIFLEEPVDSVVWLNMDSFVERRVKKPNNVEYIYTFPSNLIDLFKLVEEKYPYQRIQLILWGCRGVEENDVEENLGISLLDVYLSSNRMNVSVFQPFDNYQSDVQIFIRNMIEKGYNTRLENLNVVHNKHILNDTVMYSVFVSNQQMVLYGLSGRNTIEMYLLLAYLTDMPLRQCKNGEYITFTYIFEENASSNIIENVLSRCNFQQHLNEDRLVYIKHSGSMKFEFQGRVKYKPMVYVNDVNNRDILI